MIIKDNPLARFKDSDKMLEWKMISSQCKIPVQTLISIASRDSKTIGGISLAISETIKRLLGIDLGNYYKNTDEKASGKK